MRIAGNYTFEATREEVWAALNDPEVLAQTIPGCQQLDEVAPHHYQTTLKIGLQAVRGVYTGTVQIDNVVAPESYDLHVDGKGSNGFLKGAGTLKLRTDGVETILDYGGEAQIGGKLASIGQRLIDGAARTLINQSLKALEQQIVARRFAHAMAHTAEVEQAADEALDDIPSVTENLDAPSPSAEMPTPSEAPPATRQVPLSPDAVRRSIKVEPGQGLTETAVVRGAVEDFLKQNPATPWLIIAFLVGYLLGRRR
ncbi:carbon monoxide dehydrogenase subunit G [Candidatus Chloroploca sp. Khr17]|uniref:SRPBCC family protein n=1 Tax=Candidatus Chloroploca sp. Khr17 TaxID=2496869 RepID=UPI00101C16A0|nr:carbon monoxide dehydrogenase subunit G [Candidatus Chloroploca sp. Khr17]